MAKLGVRTIDELVGRTDLLHVKPSAAGSRAAKMDLDCILHNPAIAEQQASTLMPADTYDFHLENTLDMKVLMKKFKLGSKAAPERPAGGLQHRPRPGHHLWQRDHPQVRQLPARRCLHRRVHRRQAARALARSSPRA